MPTPATNLWFAVYVMKWQGLFPAHGLKFRLEVNSQFSEFCTVKNQAGHIIESAVMDVNGQVCNITISYSDEPGSERWT